MSAAPQLDPTEWPLCLGRERPQRRLAWAVLPAALLLHSAPVGHVAQVAQQVSPHSKCHLGHVAASPHTLQVCQALLWQGAAGGAAC